MPSPSQLAALQEIIAASTIEEVWEKAVPILKQIGPHRFTYLHAPFSQGRRFFTTGDSWITQTWVEQISSLRCELKRAFEMNVSGPFLWGNGQGTATRLISPKEQQFTEQLTQAGYINNLCIPIWGVTPKQQGLLSVLTKNNNESFESFVIENYTFLYALAHIIHVRIVLLLTKEDSLRIRLSKRERDCLFCLSTGLRNNRIAQKLGISESTIEFHTHNARRKLAAKTREEAITKALLLGLLNTNYETSDHSNQ